MATQLQEPHTHANGTCPVTDKTHNWCPRQNGDSRSPCPALNALANHGYLPRDGKNIGISDFVRGLREAYHLSRPLAYFLSISAALLLGKFWRMDLRDLARHNRLEHDASLAHADTAPGDDYAPTEPDADLLAKFCQEVRGGEGGSLEVEDAARSRVRREGECKPLDGIHAAVARGEMGLVLSVFGVKEGERLGVPVKWLREWMLDERLPAGWKPSHTTGILLMHKRTGEVQTAMKKLREAGQSL